MFTRRQALSVLSAAVAGCWLPGAASASRKLSILVGFPPGGAPDTVGRAIAVALKDSDYVAIVENKPGAGGRLGAMALASAPSDGSVIMLAQAGVLTLYPHVFNNLGFDPRKDFVPLATACEYEYAVAVGPAVPDAVKTLQDFLAWCKDNPQAAQYGTPGAGSSMHVLTMELARLAGVELLHIPYRGGAPALNDVLGGTISAVVATLPLLIPPHKAGNVRILAQSGKQRLDAIPNVPTFAEAGYPPLTMSEMFVFLGPASMSQAAQAEVAGALRAAAEHPSVARALKTAEYGQLALAPTAIASRLDTEFERWGAMVRATGYSGEG